MWKHPRNSKQTLGDASICKISTKLPNSNKETVFAVGDVFGDGPGTMCKTNKKDNVFVLNRDLREKFPNPSVLFKQVNGNKCTFELNDGSEKRSGTIVLTDEGNGVRCDPFPNRNKDYCNTTSAKNYCKDNSDGGLVIPFDVNDNTATNFNTNDPVPCFCNGNALMQCAQGTAWPANEKENAGCIVTLPQGSVSDDSNLDAPNSDSIFKSH